MVWLEVLAARLHADTWRRLLGTTVGVRVLSSVFVTVTLSAMRHASSMSTPSASASTCATGVAERRGRRWAISEDGRPRVVPIFSRGRRLEVTVPRYEPARLAGEYMQVVYGPFLESNDPSALAPFAGKGVYDTAGRYHPFEVRPNELYRLTLAGPEPYEAIYKIVA